MGDAATAADATMGFFPGGAALIVDGTAWVLAEDGPERALGAAIDWAHRQHAERLQLLVPSDGGLLARRAACFAADVTIRELDGRTQRVAAPTALPTYEPVDPRAEALRATLIAAGADAIVEEGILRGEVRGLEVARVDVDESGAHLRIGVGRYDREIHAVVHGDEPTVEDLFSVVRLVLDKRASGNAAHPAFQLAPERWLRWVVMRHPQLVGCASLMAAASPVPRPDLRRSAPAPATGLDTTGAAVVVVCSVGIDVDLVPAGADAWLQAADDDARLLFVVPEGDDHRVTRDLAAALKRPAAVVTVNRDWRGLP